MITRTASYAMSATSSAALLHYLRQHQITLNPHYRREALRLTLQALMEWEVSDRISAGHYERVDERKTYRNGYRERLWRSSVGDLPLYIPRLRQGTYHPAFLRAIEEAALNLVDHHYLSGVDAGQTLVDLCATADLPPLPSSAVYDLTDALAAAARRARAARLTGDFTALWLDAFQQKDAPEVKLVVGVDDREQAQLLDFSTHPLTDWHELLSDLKARGLQVTDQVTTSTVDARSAIRLYLPQVAWQTGSLASLPRNQAVQPLIAGFWLDELDTVGTHGDALLPMGLALTEANLNQMQAVAIA